MPPSFHTESCVVFFVVCPSSRFAMQATFAYDAQSLLWYQQTAPVLIPAVAPPYYQVVASSIQPALPFGTSSTWVPHPPAPVYISPHAWTPVPPMPISALYTHPPYLPPAVRPAEPIRETVPCTPTLPRPRSTRRGPPATHASHVRRKVHDPHMQVKKSKKRRRSPVLWREVAPAEVEAAHRDVKSLHTEPACKANVMASAQEHIADATTTQEAGANELPPQPTSGRVQTPSPVDKALKQMAVDYHAEPGCEADLTASAQEHNDDGTTTQEPGGSQIPPQPTAKEAPSPDGAPLEQMAADNEQVLGQDGPGIWTRGVSRWRANPQDASALLAWIVERTSRTNSVVETTEITVDGFDNWDAVHAGDQNGERQMQHTFVISRAQRRRALRLIPGMASLVRSAQSAIEALGLQDVPKNLQWLTAHVLNQGDVNARFEYHQDTTEERKEEGGRRDRRVLYTVIVKLNAGGCTTMQVCGHPEVAYHAVAGSSIVFRANLHHRTGKAEPGVWKLALFFGYFL